MIPSLATVAAAAAALSKQAWAGSAAPPAPLNITALASTPDGYSTIQCWQLASAPVDAMSALNYDVGNTSHATWSIIEPRTVVGEAWAPTVQLTMVLNGLIHVSGPATGAGPSNSSSRRRRGAPGPAGPPAREEGYFQPGTLSSSLLIAADLKATSHVSGHWTEFPGDEPTVLVQTPFVDNKIPDHEVLHAGPC